MIVINTLKIYNILFNYLKAKHYMLKRNSEFSEKMVQKSSLHMKRKRRVSKNEKCFYFLKMDKKNVQNGIVKTLLTDKKFCLDKKIYRVSLNEI